MTIDKRLLRLQDVDLEIHRLRHRRDILESGEELRAARERSGTVEALLGELQMERDEVAGQQKRMEHDDDALGQKIAAEQKRMFGGTIVNTRELNAIESEIRNLKDRVSRLEDDLLVLMERREELDTGITSAEAELVIARADLARLQASTTTEITEIDTDLTTNLAARGPWVEQIDEELLELYDEVRTSPRQHGVGAAGLDEGGACLGCHEKLSPLELSQLKKAGTETTRCPYCRRILVQ